MAFDATFGTFRPAGAGDSVRSPLADLGFALCRPVRHWLRWRQTVAALRCLDSHMLRDVGIAAGEIDAVAHKAVTERLPARPGLRAALERTIGGPARLDRLLRDVGLDRGVIGVISIGLEEMAAAEMPASAAKAETANENSLRRAS